MTSAYNQEADLAYRHLQLAQAKHYDPKEYEEFWRDLEAHFRGEPLPSVEADALKRNYESACCDPELAALMGEPVTNSKEWIEKYGLAISFGPGAKPPPTKHLWYPSHLEAPYAEEEWRKTAPASSARLTSFQAWMLEQQPIPADFDFSKIPRMPTTIPDFEPDYLVLEDESNNSSSSSSNSSGKGKYKQAQSRNRTAEVENQVMELCASCSRLSIGPHKRHRPNRSEKKRIEDPMEKLCVQCSRLCL